MEKIRFSVNSLDLRGKKIAVTGATGGLGTAICRHLAKSGASLILLNRNMERSHALSAALQADFPALQTEHVCVDMENAQSVHEACVKLKALSPDALILNAGAYKIPRHTCTTGYDNVFQINCVSPYYMAKELLPLLREQNGNIIAVGSIAHRYSKSDRLDVDFKTRKAASLVYGNAKRYLMFGLFELFKDEKAGLLTIVHPGITFTNITNHFPPFIFALIKHPMKWIFMKPHKAALSILAGLQHACAYHQWLGPRWLDIWGKPAKRTLKGCSPDECRRIFAAVEQSYTIMKESLKG